MKEKNDGDDDYMKYLQKNFPIYFYKEDYDLGEAVNILNTYVGLYFDDVYHGKNGDLKRYEKYIEYIWKSLKKNKRDYVDNDFLIHIISSLKEYQMEECLEMFYVLKHELKSE